jgi:hypothetical protein
VCCTHATFVSYSLLVYYMDTLSRLLRNGATEDEILAGAKKAENLRKDRLATMHQWRLLRYLDLHLEPEDEGRKTHTKSGLSHK